MVMTQPDYDQKKRECFVKFCKDNGIDQEVNISIFDAFDQIFDRAYALGREKETITQVEIEEAAEDYVSFKKGGKCYPNYIVERACCYAFKDGANFTLGKQEMKQETKQESKQESKQETVISGWVARDKSGYLVLHYKNRIALSETQSGILRNRRRAYRVIPFPTSHGNPTQSK